MKWIACILGSLALITGAMAAGAQEWQELTAAEDLAGWQVLSGQWELDGGVIRGSAGPGENAWLQYTAQEFADLEITVEFRTPVPTNGGVQFHSHWLPRTPLESGESPQDAPKVMYGYQADVETRQRLSTGRLVCENVRGPIAETAPEAAGTLKQRDWNEMRIVARNGVIEVYLQGELANRTEDEMYRRGFLALQVFAFEMEEPATVVEYRNLRVRELPQEAGWVDIFDGESLNGWETYGEEKWYAEDGLLHGASGPKNSEGYVATTDSYRDFEFQGEVLMAGAGNYGFFFHVEITLREEDGYPIISGMQVEIEPGYPTSTAWMYESYKRGWLVVPDKTSLPCVALRPKEWNHLEVRVQDNHYTTWLNGIRVMDFVDDEKTTTEGFIAFQIHEGGADGILKRNLMVRPL